MDVVYCIRIQSTGQVKIGSAREDRLDARYTSHRGKYGRFQKLCVIYTGYNTRTNTRRVCNPIEATLHKTFDLKRAASNGGVSRSQRPELFDITNDELKQAIDTLKLDYDWLAV